MAVRFVALEEVGGAVLRLALNISFFSCFFMQLGRAQLCAKRTVSNINNRFLLNSRNHLSAAAIGHATCLSEQVARSASSDL
jgi:hypothetical protein